MSDAAVEVVGYAAAVVTNISVYPQAYEVWLVVGSGDMEKLVSISVTMFALQATGCTMWLIYALLKGIWPMVAGSVLTILPAGYIIFAVKRHGVELHESPHPQVDVSEIIVASGTNYLPDPTASPSGYVSPHGSI